MDSAGNPNSLPGIHSDGVGREVTERLRQACVQIYGRDGVRGSGVVWTPDGFIVTNAHLVNGPATVQLRFLRPLSAAQPSFGGAPEEAEGAA